MLFYRLRHLSLLATFGIVRVTFVSACEGDCITGISTAMVGNYSTPVARVLLAIADGIQNQILDPNRASATPAINYLDPITNEYNTKAYNNMETSIFPNHFHGKCQDPVTGVNPAGCPNPDCAVVCGTPGSIVHFYSDFRYIGYSATLHLLESLANPNSTSYQAVEKAVLADALPSLKERRMLRFMRLHDPPLAHGSSADTLVGRESAWSMEKRERAARVRALLRGFMHQMRSLLTIECGGTASGKPNGLPKCSWEDTFKPYILSFP